MPDQEPSHNNESRKEKDLTENVSGQSDHGVAPSPTQGPDPEDNAERKAHYRRPTSSGKPIDSPSSAFRGFLEKFKEKASTQAIALWLQHYNDDRLDRSHQQYESVIHEERLKAQKRSADQQKLAAHRQQRVQKQIDQEASNLESLVKDYDSRREKLLEAELAATTILADAYLVFSPEESLSEEEAAKARGESIKKSSALRQAADSLIAFAKSVLSKGDKEKAASASVQADEIHEAANLEESIGRSIRAGRHGHYKVSSSIPVGIPVRPEEAAARLGVPYYSDGHEKTEDDVDGLSGNNKGPSLQYLKLKIHLLTDRRFQAPMIRQQDLKKFGIVVGLFLGLSFGLALGWLEPSTVRPSVMKAIDPGSGIEGVIESGKRISERLGYRIGEETSVYERQKQANEPDGRLVWVLAFLGFAVANLSRMAVTTNFARVGEDYALKRFSSRSSTSKSNSKIPWLKPVIAVLVLSALTSAEVMLEQAAFSRVVLAQQSESKQVDLTIDQTQAEIAKAREREDSDLRGRVAFFAALLVMSGYLIYAASEGFLRGRDSVIKNLMLDEMNRLTEEKLIAAGISNDAIRKAFEALNGCNVLRVDCNNRLMEIEATRATLRDLRSQLDATFKMVDHSDGSETERAKQAYSDLLGVQIEMDKISEALLASSYSELEIEASRVAREELALKTQEENERRKLNQQLEHLLARAAKIHDLQLKELDWKNEDVKRLWLHKVKVLRELVDLLSYKISRSRHTTATKKGFVMKIKLFFSGEEVVKSQADVQPKQLALEIRECYQLIRATVDELMSSTYGELSEDDKALLDSVSPYASKTSVQ